MVKGAVDGSFYLKCYLASDDYTEINRAFADYKRYLGSIQNRLPPSARAFATAEWRDQTDHPQSLHDSWLESIEILETRDSSAEQPPVLRVTIRILGPYDDGHAEIQYVECSKYQLDSHFHVPDQRRPGSGHGDWLWDEVRLSADGRVIHEILWSEGGHWLFECSDILYRWIPVSTDTSSSVE